MKFHLSILITALFLVISCSPKDKKDIEVSSYFDSLEQRNIVAQLIPRIEKRYTGFDAARQQGYDSMLLDSCYLKAIHLNKKTGRHEFLYIKKDLLSHLDDSRAVIGSFLLEKGKVVSVYQDFITFRHLNYITESNGLILFRAWIDGRSMDEYLKTPELIQWPNKSVKFDKYREKWVY